VQAQQQLVRHHGANKQQEQKQGDICRKSVHLIPSQLSKYNTFFTIVAFTQ
jgi:hypothetical protein